MSTTLIVIIVAIVVVLFLISMYNNLVKLRNNRENAFANIDVQLKQRYDLIPQLVSTVKGTPLMSANCSRKSLLLVPLQ